MATGYTMGVVDGSVSTFKDFATQCARAFGACVMQRDDPFSDVPKHREKTDHHAKELVRVKRLKKKLSARTDIVWQKEAERRYVEERLEYNAHMEEHRIKIERIQTMMVHVANWTPPTSEHENAKTFMTDQLSETLKHEYEPYPPKRLDSVEWKNHCLNSVNRDIDYHTTHDAEDIARCDESNKWIDDFLGSL